ncbi:nucleolar protein 14 homolog [Cimex lectularius]|uniref:Nucleolar protein 14 homolog n=1 Tax=Cimex lectularius TaxID=79782 RepID=A0A8I6RZP8_CIMLE|nr:nucleolar protein 14 homolog [Cimex lectularius]
MGKMKGRSLSDAKLAGKNGRKAKNPFEVHVNRQKFNVLGRKMKTDFGLPGVSRAKALKKRKETLLQEYKIKNKSNRFLDRRIGEKNSAMTKDDKIMARFTAERMKTFNKKTIYNLIDDEVLTHRGRTLAEIENDDPRSDDDNEYGPKGLDAQFVEEAHFGGGLLKKVEGGRATVIEQLIAESKTRKAEKAQEKEKNIEATDKLDKEWRDLMPFLASKSKAAESAEEQPAKKFKKDDFDVLLNELRFEARGTPQDRLKTEEEIAKQEAKKLAELEEERIRRMKGDDMKEILPTSRHRSADDLDDGLDIEEEETYVLTYDKDGKPVGLNNDDNMFKKRTLDSFANGDGECDYDEDDDEEEESEDDEENGPEDLSDLKVGLYDEENKEDKENESNEEEEEETKESKNIEEENLETDTKKSAKKNETDNTTNREEKCLESEATKMDDEQKKKKVTFSNELKVKSYIKDSELLKRPDKMKSKKDEEVMEKARQELPYTFSVPDEYDGFLTLMKPKTPTEQTVVIERMIKCNHPSLLKENLQKMELLFKYLICYFDEEHSEVWTLLDYLSEHLYTLVHFAPANTAKTVIDALTKKHSSYKQKKGKYPNLSTLVLFKLITRLYPTSDKWHLVATPCIIFISELLRECHVTNKRSVSSGMFLVSLLSQFVRLSKRLLPEGMNFLSGIIHMCCPPSSSTFVTMPFKKENKILFLQQPVTELDVEYKMYSSDLTNATKTDDSFRVRCLFTCLRLVQTFADLYKDLIGVSLFLQPILNNVKKIEVDKYPLKIQEMISSVIERLQHFKEIGFSPITFEEKKPKALRLYEPDFQPVFDGKKKPGKSSEHTKLLSKYKKEMKGALREIRKDRSFLASIKFKEQAESDAERIRRVKQIYSWGAEQQGELNKLERKKKSKK